MNIGKCIKRLRKEKGWSQGEMGVLCEITQTSLSQIETETCYPHRKTLLKICEVLEISELYLYLDGATDKELQECLTVSLNKEFNK